MQQLRLQKSTLRTIEALNYFRANLRAFSEITDELVDLSISDIRSEISAQKSNYIVTTLVAILISFLLFLLAVPVLSNLIRYEEKIMMLITRVTVDECEQEAKKYERVKDVLSAETHKWTSHEFLQEIMLSQTKGSQINTDRATQAKQNVVS